MKGERPYQFHRIAQLDALIERAGSDLAALRRLDHELSLRTTATAKTLRAKLAAAIDAASAAHPQPRSPEDAEKGGGRRPTPRQAQLTQLPRLKTPSANTTAPRLGSETAVPPATPATNAPAAVLAAWTALEALTPQTYRRPEDLAGGDRRAIAALPGDRLPWTLNETARPKHQLFYQLVLGAIPMDRATASLVAAFGADEERGSRVREKAAIAAVLVDRNGVPVAEKGIAVSSFAWALPLALKGEFGTMGTWPAVEAEIVAGLDRQLRRQDKEGRPLPLDRAAIDAAHRWLVQRLGLPEPLAETPTFALRVHHSQQAKAPPEVSLLNSFFMGDLARATNLLRQGTLPAGLRRYLGGEAPQNPVDLLADHDALEQAVAPARMPAARWPSPGGHDLVLLQQAAVNLARSELTGTEGLLAVNGPPGTGKTTLLRDLVAGCVLDRALAMAAFDDPEQAFTASGERIAVGEKGYFNLHALHPSLKGHEVLVASSNNKAVENISRKLPAATAVGRPPEALGYFRSISDLLQAQSADTDEGERNAALSSEPAKTWGLIAAVLGNRTNVAAFQQAFWWDPDRSFRLYLKAAKGDLVLREVKDPATGTNERRPPAVVIAEQPPSPQAAKEAWHAARETLLTLKREVDADLKRLEAVRQLCLRHMKGRRATAAEEEVLASQTQRRSASDSEHLRCQAEVRKSRHQLAQRIGALERSLGGKPKLLARLLRTRAWRAWSNDHAPLAEAASVAKTALQAAERALAETTTTRERLAAEIGRSETRVATARQTEAKLANDVAAHRPALGDRMIDDAFFARDHEAMHLGSPWLPDALQRKREDLFAASLGVHRAFLDAAARKVHHNLGALMDVMSAGPPPDEAKRKLLGDLWSTLFLTVPVVSTTFASSQRMLGALPPGSLGWLLIDEAGQALPQAAVGAMLRAKRVVAVGDPLQIQPVVTVPQRLSAEICKVFKVDPARWAPPQASVQTVTDRASRFQATIKAQDGPRRVGVPLLVHRRCQEPMFGMFNRIAYGGQMVQASKPSKEAGIGAALGPSRWIDVAGPADTKWSPAEGDAVVGLLKTIAAAGVTKPDLFVVTPFRIVAQEMRRRLEEERTLFAALDLDARGWAKDHVGTVHTVQGREAEAVILVLGAPNAGQVGARHWAAETPNILNVAISRARENLYVVGSAAAWSGIGHANELTGMSAEYLKVGGDGLSLSAAGGERDPQLGNNQLVRRRGPSP